MSFSKEDSKQLLEKGISEELIARQLQQFEDGFPNLEIKAAAVAAKGIKHLDTEQEAKFLACFEKLAPSQDLMKFVPASGAATRMFKKLFEFNESYKGTEADYQDFCANAEKDSMQTFFANLQEYPFVEELNKASLEEFGLELDTLLEQKEYVQILNLLLTDLGLNYGTLPKGLIAFHKYATAARTPVAEHMESAAYLFRNIPNYKVHFTISESYLSQFQQETTACVQKALVDAEVEVLVSFSSQKPATDTLAVDESNQPIRDENGQLLFRPGGHGALIHNLNEVAASVLFVKNIDNVVPDRMKEQNAHYERLLGGVLLHCQQQIFHFLEQLDEGVTRAELAEMVRFVKDELCYDFKEDEKNLAAQLRGILNRPIRVCGMVINEGEPGGGPFFVKDAEGNVSLQIVESSQINLSDATQKAFFEQSTHFNPVDLVCGVKDYKGNAFNLLDYVDEKAGFISCKSFKGKSLKALELPGLWNGAMANWNTIFVEVPVFTFNPVKTIFDLLRDEHRN